MKQKIKAVFTDIDGTLYSHTAACIPAASRKVIQDARKLGIPVFGATGRHRQEMEQLHLDIDLDGWISLNGALCYDDRETWLRDSLDEEDIKALLSFLESHPFPVQFMEEDLMYINMEDERVRRALDAIHTPYPEIHDMRRALSHKTYLVIPWVSEEIWAEAAASMKHIKYTRWNDLAADVMSITCGKKNGVYAACARYGIDPANTMAVGDGPNDIELFEACGLAIAMGNADDAVKEAADIIAEDIEAGGFEKIFRKYILDQEE